MATGKKKDTAVPAPVYAVFGHEAFLKRQGLARITDQVLGKADRALSLSEYEGPSAELAPVMDDLRTLPFLAERRLVIVREADTFITRFRTDLEEYADHPSATGVLVLECKSLAANTRLYKKIAALGGLVPCEAVKANAIGGWLVARCRDGYGLQLDSAAASLLVHLVGNDLGLLDGELWKLSLYVGERKRITTADVEALVGHQREEEIWGIMSAMAAGDESRALTLWEQVWQTDKAAEARAVAGIAYKVRQLLNAKKAQEAGASINELGKMLMIWGNPQRVQAELSAFSAPQLERMLCQLLEADVAAKSGGASVQSSIEALIVNVCRAKRARQVAGR
ncbi:MAG TPA: DNA polymerase III subunit delta [Phycisphaerae bacterium]|jgi:DNA polymerase-3 subunit delta|nr:DNA polymerase III subunit delta [Phycisphaerae bacterium]HOB73896.1 DNA polymerase III subunit delta [Phycisphaerae bacterium]HOJ56157.1 DNA polymerase III subunit delta [Phycisphaerae bacterium]HOL28102.1 DNA polymerase III subunit delta [Phycisphaerae bacterium]HPP19787.1 DNA polymerase III subunit delta [Phycisphaerae bacterium]